MPTSPKSKHSTQVPGQFLGYSLQTTRCLARLLVANPGSFVSVEVFDDVGVVNADGSVTAEQSKSALAGNPVADRARDLWKTFGNWIDGVDSGDIIPDVTDFEIFVTPRREGALVKLLSDASTDTEVVSAVQTVKSTLWGIAPHFTARQELSDTIAPYVNHVLMHEGTFSRIVSRFRLDGATGDFHADALEQLAKWYPNDTTEDIYLHMLGWVKDTLDALISSGQPAVVETDSFRNQLFAYVRRTDPKRVLRCYARELTQTEINQERALKTYVRQLDIIGCDVEDQVNAVIDYFRASTNRTVWSQKGYVDSDEFDEYEDRLKDIWRNTRRRALAAYSSATDVHKGQVILSDCLLAPCQLCNADQPGSFSRGSLHALAESLAIGWHPNYVNLLKGE